MASCCAAANSDGQVNGQSAHTLVTANYEVFSGTTTLFEIGLRTTLDGDRVSMTGTFRGSGIAGLFLGGGSVYAHSLWQPGQKKIVPLDFAQFFDRGTRRDAVYRFDADKLSVKVQLGERLYHISTPPDVHSIFTMHIQLGIDAQQSRRILSYDVLSNRKLRRYKLLYRGEEPVTTPAGDFMAVRFDRIREGRLDYRYWLSPQHDYLPVRAASIGNNRIKYYLHATSISVYRQLPQVRIDTTLPRQQSDAVNSMPARR